MSVSGIQLPGGMDGHPWSAGIFLRSSFKKWKIYKFSVPWDFFLRYYDWPSILILTRKISILLKIYHFQEDNLNI